MKDKVKTNSRPKSSLEDRDLTMGMSTWIKKAFMGTLRQSIIFVLKEQELTAKSISQAVGIREKEVYEHLVHISRSRSLGGKFVLIPSTCRECGFVFKKRDRLTPPSRCFLCRSESITPPRFSIQIK